MCKLGIIGILSLYDKQENLICISETVRSSGLAVFFCPFADNPGWECQNIPTIRCVCQQAHLTEMAYLGRLFHLLEFKDVPEEQIKTTGYVIDSIEAAVWCLLTTDSYNC